MSSARVAQPIIQRLKPHTDGEKQPALLNYYIFTDNG